MTQIMKSSGAAALTFALMFSLTFAAPGDGGVTLRAVSSRPDMLSGGSVLLEITGLADPLARNLRTLLNGRDVGEVFRPRGQGGLLGRVEGLALGKNTLEIKGPGSARLELINHPITGPVFSGAQEKPFVCQTEAAGLGPAIDSDCSAKTSVAYFYTSTASAPAPSGAPQLGALAREFKPFDASQRPADLAKTTTTQGRTVDYIVRSEMGTINRAIYSISFLHDPGQPLPDPWTATPGWNGRLVYLFAGGCGAGYHQGGLASTVTDAFLYYGYAVATSSLNVLGNNCDDVTSAETMMMVREYFIKQFGIPVHVIGAGGSGGSMQQHLIAQNYPGLLDGILPGASYPDITTVLPSTVDCTLLDRAFKASTHSWTEEQKTAVSGFASWGTCASWSRSFSPGWLVPTHCDPSVPKALIYEPTVNPKGARCTVYDHEFRTYGRDPKTGFALQPLDNTGVQYGLAAFNAGRITADQFLELNERVGGYDVDGNPAPARNTADPAALRSAYQKGRVNAGAGSLGSIPIIDSRVYVDTDANIHDRHRSLVTRARLIAAHGNANNHVILTYPAKLPVAARPSEVRLMDQWLDNIDRDKSHDTAAVKTARTKPPELTDACWTPEGEKIAELQTYDGSGRCNQLYPNHANPRIAAGAPLANDILKCALKPVDPKVYSQPLTQEQASRLRTIFPQGVCDYGRPGVEQQPVQGTWLTYE